MAIDLQHAFLENVKNALSDIVPERNKNIITPVRPENAKQTLDKYQSKSVIRQMELLEKLKENAKPINLNIIPVKTLKDAREGLIRLIQEKSPEYGTQKKVAAWHHSLIESLDLQPALADLDIPLVLPPKGTTEQERESLRQDIIESFVGITSADYCVAETGTLTMKTRAGQPRSVSLVPMIHAAVIRADQLVDNLSELYFRLQWDPEEQEQGLTNCMTFISGPSKTGDIELVMVHGAHGPRELHLYVITGEEK